MLKALKILTTMTDICVMTIDREILRQSISYGHRPSRGSDHDGLDEVRGGGYSGMFVAPLTIPPPLYRERRWGVYREGARTHEDPTVLKDIFNGTQRYRDTEIQYLLLKTLISM